MTTEAISLPIVAPVRRRLLRRVPGLIVALALVVGAHGIGQVLFLRGLPGAGD